MSYLDDFKQIVCLKDIFKSNIKNEQQKIKEVKDQFKIELIFEQV